MKKLKLSTKPKLIKSEDTHTLEFKLIYPVKNKKEYSIYNDFLSHLLCESTSLIPDETEFQKEKLRYTILDYSFYTNTLVNNLYLIISFSLPQENLINDYDLEESFKFIVDAIRNPIFNDPKKTQEQFYHIKEFFLKKYESVPQEIYGANDIVIRSIIDPNEDMEFSYESYGNFLKNIKIEDIFNYYKENIINNDFISYVHGNINEDKVNYLFDKYLQQDKKVIEFDIDYIKFLPLSNESFHEFNTPFNQAQIVMEYQALDIKENEKIILTAIMNILQAQENNLIFNNLRVKNGLVYDTYLRCYSSYGLFTVEAFINSENKDKVMKIISETIDLLKDINNVKGYFEKLLQGYKVDILKQDDGLYKNLNKTINGDLKINTVTDDYLNLLKISPEDIVNFMDRIKLTNVILFKEGIHD